MKSIFAATFVATCALLSACVSTKGVSKADAIVLGLRALPSDIQDSLDEYYVTVHQYNTEADTWAVRIASLPDNQGMVPLGGDYFISVHKFSGKVEIFEGE